ncbi:MAG TPA: bifunctional 4-hydroxy-2-oxoglutarate aldolase/2-dehydro-3-deoxy-phosphogluconate aldolase [Clostridia bacterium]|nr:bifunctional 4-hydroxy-2-oxoglutarate aldolase/2-dehydro-3-deoxy-phosphogluconate aldolase [Clostridia bacterium]
MTVIERMGKTRLIPVCVIENAATATPAARAMLRGGVDIMEITLRTPAGLDAIELVSRDCPDMLVGAGTVLTLESCKTAVARGAQFIVSPGYDPIIVSYCIEHGIFVLPGCVTSTEITVARNAGLGAVKFFPAGVYGGIRAIRALAAPFSGTKFVPTGGIDARNLAEYLVPDVLAVGGGWLCERSALIKGDFEAITDACAESMRIVAAISGCCHD